MSTRQMFTKVTHSDYYGCFDSVGGRFQGPGDVFPVRHGMPILVRWPNGRVTRERLRIAKGCDSMQVDMNDYPDTFSTRTFTVRHVIHGYPVEVPLFGRAIARVASKPRKAGA